MNETTAKQEPAASPTEAAVADLRRALEDRLATEERRSRGSRILGWIAMVLAVVAASATGALFYFATHGHLPVLTSSTLRAEEVVLVDDQGNERGYWTVEPDGAARLVLVDPQGVERMKLTVRADGEQGLSMADAGGSNRVVLGHLADRSSSLAFADSEGTTRAVLGMSGANATSLLFADRNGGTRAALGLSAAGDPTFWWPEVEGRESSEPSDNP